MFFQLSHEGIDKKKRYIKERRKELENINKYVNPYKNSIVIGSTSEKEKDKNSASFANVIGELERRKVGLGKRMNLKEMLRLQKSTKQECIKQMGLGFLPRGTKASMTGQTNLMEIIDKDK
jgi:hypothetical protein